MTKTRQCKICGSSSKEKDFYSGVTSRCKDCHKEMVKKNRDEKSDYYREYDKKRFSEDPRVRERHIRYKKTDAGKAALIRGRKKWINKNPEARAAHLILGNAVRSGRLDKPSDCSSCGCTPRRRDLHAHHEDYAKPIDVIWLCSKCHSKRHNN